MGGGGSKASGGGGKGVSRGDICRHDSRRPCPSGGEGSYSTHDICYKGRVYSDKGRADGCYDRTDKICTTGSSYLSVHSNSRGGEGSKSTGSKKEESKASGLSYGGTIEYSGGYSSVVLSSIPPRESYIANPYAPQHVKALESYLFKKYGGLNEASRKGIILGYNSMNQREELDASINGRKLPSESFAMRVLKMQLTGASLTVASRELAPKVMKVITMCDDNLQDSDLLKLQMFCYLPRIKFNLDALYLHRNQITDVGVKYLLNAYVPDSGLKVSPLILERIVKENIKGFINAPGYRSVIELNLSSNQIGDDGAKLLADSLVKGEMPKLKVLRLEDNKITDKGVSYYLDNLKKDQLNSTYVSFTASKSTIDKIMEFFGKGARYYVSEYEKAQQSSKEADIAVNGKDGFGHCVQVVRTAGIDLATAMAQKAIAAPPIVKKAMEQGHPRVKLIIGGGLVVSSLNELKGAFLSEDFAHCMAFLNKSHDEEYDVGLLGQY